jgi:hypothetical protein
MVLKLKTKGSSAPFADYLKKFAKVRKSLLLEIDPNKECFVAKTYTEDHSVVFASTLSFENAGFEIVEHKGDTNGNRIKLGVVVNLDKLIKIVNQFGSNFEMTFNYDVLTNDEKEDYICQEVSFKSNILKMKMNGSKIGEFQYLPDDTFENVVFKVTDEVKVPVSADTVSTAIKTSAIAAIDPKKDSLIFYIEDGALFVKDNTGKDENGDDRASNFEYKLADLTDAPTYPVRLPISREKFVLVLDGNSEAFEVIIGKDVRGDLSRILFASTETDTKIVISTINE